MGGGNNNGNGGGRNQMFDSNGPDGRIRGNAHQVMERYLVLARDSMAQDDRVMAENCYQHAEHYLRLLNAYNQSNPPPRRAFPAAASEDQPETGEQREEAESDTESENNSEDDQASEEPVAEAV